MTEQMAHIVYLIAGVLFIFSLAGLAKQETARSGNLCGIIGMAIAILGAMAMASGGHSLVYAAIALGAVLGAIVASRVAMDRCLSWWPFCIALSDWLPCWWALRSF